MISDLAYSRSIVVVLAIAELALVYYYLRLYVWFKWYLPSWSLKRISAWTLFMIVVSVTPFIQLSIGQRHDFFVKAIVFLECLAGIVMIFFFLRRARRSDRR
jgi:hypothetical protein